MRAVVTLWLVKLSVNQWRARSRGEEAAGPVNPPDMYIGSGSGIFKQNALKDYWGDRSVKGTHKPMNAIVVNGMARTQPSTYGTIVSFNQDRPSLVLRWVKSSSHREPFVYDNTGSCTMYSIRLNTRKRSCNSSSLCALPNGGGFCPSLDFGPWCSTKNGNTWWIQKRAKLLTYLH